MQASTHLPSKCVPLSTWQTWCQYDSAIKQWSVVEGNNSEANRRDGNSTIQDPTKLSLVTWNVDGFGQHKRDRIRGIISRVKSLDPIPDIIFLQEVSLVALHSLLTMPWIRENWFSSEKDVTNWQFGPFATIIFVSKARFTGHEETRGMASLGAIWRVRYPSRYGRDAFCCDISLPASPPPTSASASEEGSAASASTPAVTSPTTAPTRRRVRLINVHLDSLPRTPSLRPLQLQINSAMLRTTGCGLVAGDFNPVLPEDATLVEENGLVDAWRRLHPDDPGFTWGVDGKASFPPGRLDKIAMFGGLNPQEMAVMHPGSVGTDGQIRGADKMSYEDLISRDEETTPWSDHSGLQCSFRVC